MALTLGSGPFAGSPGGAFNFSLGDAPRHRIFFEPFPRRVRAVVAGTTVVDTTGAMLLHETAIRPVVYVPLADVDAALLAPTQTRTHCPFKGDASYWTVTAGDRVVEDALWAYEQPLPDAGWLQGYGALYWEKVDTWLVEDDEVTSILDPYHRIDVHPTSRRVTVTVKGERIAESTRAKLLFETGLAPRAYLPREDVAVELTPTSTTSHCPYKGDASYWSGAGVEDLAWSYETPLRESEPVRGLVSFWGDDVVVEVANR
jgi:uncharacterized protein (DUF427 family)